MGSRERAGTNVIGKKYATAQFAGTHAHADLCQWCSARGLPLPRSVMAANLGLVMGDLNACDWAVEAHLRLLSTHGAFGGLPLVLNRRPLPRGPL